MQRSDRIKASLYAGIMGDALGVPVEATPRTELALCAVKNMLGYGRYDQPEGTWSDDSSMSLCTMESLCRGYDLDDIGNTFAKWLFEAYWTPTGFVFDVGLTTYLSIDRIHTEGISARASGCRDEDDNGNGSLMRILPAALYFARLDLPLFLERIHEISAITHAHPRAMMGCGIYGLMVRALLDTNDKHAAYRRVIDETTGYYSHLEGFAEELSQYARIFSGEVDKIEEIKINSSGYVVDTLEAALWCFLRNDDARSVILSAVNLGLDTDTTGMVAGGLAGLQYGLTGIDESWLSMLARKSDIDELINRFEACLPRQ